MTAWPALISGVLFGMGLTLSGMSDPAKIIGFLDITGAWIPDLVFVMGGAVVTLILTPLATSREAPLMAPAFSLPNKNLVDRRLIVGAVLFGIGWGISGYCPGPAFVGLLYGHKSTLLFCLAMFSGMALESRLTYLFAH